MIKLFQLMMYLVIHDVVTSTVIQLTREMRSKMITLRHLLFPQPFPRMNKNKTCIENTYSRYFISFNFDLLKRGFPRQSYASLEPCEKRATTLHSEVASYNFLLLLGESGSHNYQNKLSQTVVTQRGKMDPPRKFICKGKAPGCRIWKVWFSNFTIKYY